jgi:hypothetical protein
MYATIKAPSVPISGSNQTSESVETDICPRMARKERL